MDEIRQGKSLASDVLKWIDASVEVKTSVETRTEVDVLFEIVAFRGDGKTGQALVENVLRHMSRYRAECFDQTCYFGDAGGRRSPESKRILRYSATVRETPTEKPASAAGSVGAVSSKPVTLWRNTRRSIERWSVETKSVSSELSLRRQSCGEAARGAQIASARCKREKFVHTRSSEQRRGERGDARKEASCGELRKTYITKSL